MTKYHKILHYNLGKLSSKVGSLFGYEEEDNFEKQYRSSCQMVKGLQVRSPPLMTFWLKLR